jgi:predicted nucleotidyltransferase
VKQVGLSDDPNLGILIPVVLALGDLCDSLVFVGGCAVGLLVTTERAQRVRPTKDVDVLAEVTSVKDYHALERLFETRGFEHDVSRDAPICRWLKDGIMVDLMPSEEGVLGFHNRWYPLAIRTADRVRLPDGHEINLVSPPVFMATKIEAFRGRGNNDFLASHDLEDVISVIDGRDELMAEVNAADKTLKQYLGDQLRGLLATRAFQDALPGYLSGDSATQARLPQLMEKLRSLAKIE